jgi:hypothetical protein
MMHEEPLEVHVESRFDARLRRPSSRAALPKNSTTIAEIAPTSILIPSATAYPESIRTREFELGSFFAPRGTDPYRELAAPKTIFHP